MRVHPFAAITLAALALAAPASADPPAPGTLLFASDRCEQGGIKVSGLPGEPEHCQSGIFRMARDGSVLNRLTQGPDFSPAWSPDGLRMAFVHSTGNGTAIRVVSVGAAEPELTIAPPPETGSVSAPAWSPDGKQLAVQANAGLDNSVWVTTLATESWTRLTPSTEWAFDPQFTPDGRVSYFASPADPTGESNAIVVKSGIYSRTAEGSGLRRLALSDVSLRQGGPEYSPDGKTVAVPLDGTVYTARADGGGLRARSGAIGAGQLDWSGTTLYFAGVSGTGDFAPRSIFRLDPSAKTGIALAQSGTARDGEPDGYDAPPAVAADKTAPGALLELLRGGNGDPPKGASSDRVGLLAFDASGVERMDVALAKRAGKKCRYANRKGKLGKPVPCKKRRFRRLKDEVAWHAMTARLPKGKYVTSLKLRDVAGNKRTRRLSFKLG